MRQHLASSLPTRLVLGCLAFFCLLATVRAAEPFISEFVPDNAKILADEDGTFPDWIEIQNPNAAPLNLAGYFLTDDALVRNKWAFPAATVPGNGFLVVFASGKNRTNDPAHLHTSFSLAAGGGYLALVKPDATTVISEYAGYPSIKEDSAFGVSTQPTTTSLLAGTVARVLVPTSAGQLPANWNQLNYVPDGAWASASVPPAVGFDTNLAVGLPSNVAPSGTAAQSTINSSFTPNLAINNNFGDFMHTLGTDPAPFWQVTLTNEMAIFEVVLFNRTSCCGSRLRDITVEILSTNSGTLVTNWTSPLLNPENTGSVYPNGPAYLSNNLVIATGSPVQGSVVRVRRTPDLDLSGSGGQGNTDEGSVLSLGEVQVNASAASGLRPYFNTDIQSLMFNVNPSAFVRLPFRVEATPDTLTLNVRYDDGFVAFLNGVEVASRNAGASPAFNGTALTNRNLAGASAIESIDLSAAIPSLLNGTNVLAFQLLNSAANNGDALLQPELIAATIQKQTNVFLNTPTPGTANTTGWYFDEVADTRFSVNRGYFTNAFSLSITSATPGALIYISYNGDEPGPNKGFLYTNALTITNTTVVRARAFKPNWKPTGVDSSSYLFVADIINQARTWPAGGPPQYFPATWGINSVDYGMDPQVVTNYSLSQWYEAFYQIGTMSIITEMTNLFDAATGIYANAASQGELWERPISLELIDPTNAVQGRFQENAGLRIRGGASRGSGFYKHSFRVYFRKEYGTAKLKYPLFEDEGADEFDVFALRTSQNYSWPRNDNSTHDTMVREVFCRKTLGDMGQPYRRSRYYHLYLNGQYWGLYETDEHPAAGYGETYFGGQKENYDVVKNHDRYTSPPAAFSTEATDGNLTAFSNLWVMCRAHAANPTQSNYFRILGCNPDGTRDPNLPVMVDVGNLIDYMLSIFYTGDGDATLSAFLSNNRPNNWYGMRDRTNPNVGFRFFNNDCEHTLGSPNSQVDRTGPFRNASGSNIDSFTYANPQYMHEDLMWSPEYRQRFADHVQRHFFNGGALTLQASTNRFIAKAQQITKAIRAYSARWGDPVTDGLGRAPYGEADWTNTLNQILTVWFPPRAGIVLAQLRADQLFPSNSAPNFSQLGGAVPAGFSLSLTQTNTSGVIYYTLDGSDPRSVGGGVNAGAIAYSGTLPINSPTTVRARVLTGTNWSALVESTFYPPQDLSKLQVTEIMYHPPDIGLIDGAEYEFLELKNNGTNAMDLSGLRFTSGITYTFPIGSTLQPGQFFVLARNAAEFSSKYPGVTINGLYTGRLDNAGESLTLSHPLGTEVFSITYADALPWPITADGLGFSLVPSNHAGSLEPNQPAYWRASTGLGGSPGTEDPASAIAPVLINEILSHTETGVDFIELFNPTTNAVDIGGWFLSDDALLPKKFRIADGTILAPLGFTVFTEAQFNSTPGTNNSFSLSARGDDVYLFSGDASTNLTGYSHGFAFGAAPDGETFGRYMASTGEELFPAQSTPTQGGVNAGPRVGPVVISEIMYNPPLQPGSGSAEFVEIHNLTASPVPLFDPAHPTNTWRLSGLGFTFPENVTLAPHGFLVIVATNRTAFSATYPIPGDVPFFETSGGQLQKSGERLELQRPDVPDTNGIAYITVDEVRYNDRAPWPAAADGSGPSLHRLAVNLYGNDPANWTAAIPTPGTGFAGGVPPVMVGQPQSRSTIIGSNVVITATVSGTAPFQYQWQFNGLDLPGATNAALTLANVQTNQAGFYRVLVYNSAGVVISAQAELIVLTPVYFTQQPVNQSVLPGTNVTLSAAAVGNGPVRFQWRYEGVNIPGATNSSYSFTNAQLVNHGNYTVVLTDNISTISSSNAFVFVLIRPGIIVHPLPQSVVQRGTAVFSVVATGAPPLSYRWLRSGSLYASNLFPNLIITNATSNGTFRVQVSNLAGTANSVPSGGVTLTVLPDFDIDGIADAWETNYAGFSTNNAGDGLLDFDGDGMSNRDEFQAGTNPNDPLSLLKIVQDATNATILNFVAQSNVTYTVQYRPSLTSTAWLTWTNVPATTNLRTIEFTAPAAPEQPERYFRIVTPVQP